MVFLRNGWYTENNTEALAPALAYGAIPGAAGAGRFACAARADYAEAAAVVLASPRHENAMYELAGDTSYSLPELAAEVSKVIGKQIDYRNLPEEPYAGMLASVGLPKVLAELLAAAESGAQR